MSFGCFRLWTRGYDVYTPSRIIVAHDYSGVMFKSVPKRFVIEKPINTLAWASMGMSAFYRGTMFSNSLDRMHTLLGMPEGGGFITEEKLALRALMFFRFIGKDAASVGMLTKYGLGFKRTLDQFIEFTGIDTRSKKVFGDR